MKIKRGIALLLILTLMAVPFAAPAENWWEQFKEDASALWEDVKGLAGVAGDSISESVSEWWPLITSAGKEGWKWLCEEASVIGNYGAEKWQQLRTWLQENTEERLRGIVEDLLQQLSIAKDEISVVTDALSDYASAHDIPLRKVLCLSLPYLVHLISGKEQADTDGNGLTAQELADGLIRYLSTAGVVDDDTASKALDGLEQTIDELCSGE